MVKQRDYNIKLNKANSSTETHNRIFLWLGKDVSSELLKHVTGNLDLDKINPQMKCLPKIEESVLKNPLWILYNNMALNSASLPKFQLIRHSLDLEVELSSVMVEDEVYSQMDYSDYLCEIHKQIKQEVIIIIIKTRIITSLLIPFSLA